MAAKRILILGDHPATENIVRQHNEIGAVVKWNHGQILDVPYINQYDKLYLLGGNIC